MNSKARYFALFLSLLITPNLFGEQIHEAAKNGDVDTVRRLLSEDRDLVHERGEGVGRDHDSGLTPLHVAAHYGQPAVVLVLLKFGAHIEARTLGLGNTPLHFAAGAENNSSQTVEILIQAGANVDASGSEGETPCHFAAVAGNAEVIGLLARAHANLNAKNMIGQTPKQLAKANNKRHASALLYQLEIIGSEKPLVHPIEHVNVSLHRPAAGIAQIFYGADEDLGKLLAVEQVNRYIEMATEAPILVNMINCDARTIEFGNHFNFADEKKKIVIYEWKEWFNEILLPEDWVSGTFDIGSSFHSLLLVNIRQPASPIPTIFIAFDHGIRLKNTVQVQVYIGTSKEQLAALLEARYFAKDLAILDLEEYWNNATSGSYPLLQKKARFF